MLRNGHSVMRVAVNYLLNIRAKCGNFLFAVDLSKLATLRVNFNLAISLRAQAQEVTIPSD